MIRVIQTFTVPMSLCFLRGQIDIWRQNGYELSVFSSKSDTLQPIGEQNQIQTQTIDFERQCKPLKDLRALGQLYRHFRRLKPQIVHGNTPKAALLTMIAARFAGVRHRVYEVHGLPSETPQTNSQKIYLPIAEWLTCAFATHIIAVSPSVREVLINQGFAKPNKVSVMHHGSCNGIDAEKTFNPSLIKTAQTQQLRTQLGFTNNQPVVGFVGRKTLEKGISELYEAWQHVKKLFPTAQLLMLGGDDERTPLPNEMKQKLENDPSIHCLNHKENIAEYYALMDFLVLPSHREGLGNVVLEAAAMQKPAVVTAVTGLKDAVVGDKTGIFCKPTSPDDLAAKIIYYLQNPALVRAHGRDARERTLLEFDPKNVWRAKIQLYGRLLAPFQYVPLSNVPPIFQTSD